MKIRIYFENMQDKLPAGYTLKHLVRRAVAATLEHEGIERDAEVSVTFIDDAGIRRLNQKHRGIDKPTDVLSFPLGEEPYGAGGKALVLGDIVISLERAAAQAEEFGHGYERETAFLCVHSMLHLLGYDHEKSESDDLEMRRRQREIMKNLGLAVAGDEGYAGGHS